MGARSVGPGTTKLVLTVAGYQGAFTFTVGDPDQTLELRDLGDGWHAFNTETGFGSEKLTATATAYDADGRAMGSRNLTGS